MKLIAVVGPTSSGKTSLGIKLAKRFGGEIISADSRQVYKDLDIGTGKDLPKDSEFSFVSDELGGYYLIDGVRIWGYDLVDPDQGYSVSQYIQVAKKMIEHISDNDKIPILVGGTGFYIKGVLDGIDTAHIPQNKPLREKLKDYTVEGLFEKLANIDPEKAGTLNISDKKNPRRLVRAIEIAQWRMKNKAQAKTSPIDADVVYIGLMVKKNVLEKRIRERVQKRLDMGFEEEVEDLVMSGVGWDNQSMQALGYMQWQDHLKGKISKEKAFQDWVSAENKYAKKQMTWFKKDPRINWFDQSDEDWQQEVIQLVNEWIKKDES